MSEKNYLNDITNWVKHGETVPVKIKNKKDGKKYICYKIPYDTEVPNKTGLTVLSAGNYIAVDENKHLSPIPSANLQDLKDYEVVDEPWKETIDSAKSQLNITLPTALILSNILYYDPAIQTPQKDKTTVEQRKAEIEKIVIENEKEYSAQQRGPSPTDGIHTKKIKNPERIAEKEDSGKYTDSYDSKYKEEEVIAPTAYVAEKEEIKEEKEIDNAASIPMAIGVVGVASASMASYDKIKNNAPVQEMDQLEALSLDDLLSKGRSGKIPSSQLDNYIAALRNEKDEMDVNYGLKNQEQEQVVDGYYSTYPSVVPGAPAEYDEPERTLFDDGSSNY